MVIKIIFTFLSTFLFLFLFWRKLKDDYAQNQIFTTGFYSLFGVALLSVVADNFIPGWWFWLSLFGAFIGVAIGILRYRMRFFETLEAWVIASLSLIFLVHLYSYIYSFDTRIGLGLIVTVFLFVLFSYLDVHYKKFTWYRSGRIGFTGLFVLGLFFLIRTVVAISFSDVLSFVGGVDAVLSGVIAFITFITLFNLSRVET